MTLYYKCLQCGKEFPLASGKTEGKFCCGEHYAAYRKVHGTQAVKDTPAIFIREEHSRKSGRPKGHKDPEETTTAPLSSSDNKNIEQSPDEDPESQQSASIDFEDLSINDLKLIISDLLIQNEKLQSELQHLALLLNEAESKPSPLNEVVNNFIRQLITLEIGEDPDTLTPFPTPSPLINLNRLCAAPKCKNPVDGGRVFCSKECAKKMLTNKASRMILNDGTLIGGDLNA